MRPLDAGRSVVAQVLVVALIVGLGVQAHLNLAAALTAGDGFTEKPSEPASNAP